MIHLERSDSRNDPRWSQVYGRTPHERQLGLNLASYKSDKMRMLARQRWKRVGHGLCIAYPDVSDTTMLFRKSLWVGQR
jgi:hypothetical protein